MPLPVPEVRPKSVTTLVDDTFQVYGRHWQDFVLVGLPVFVPFALLAALVREAVGLRTGFSGAFSQLTPGTTAVTTVHWSTAIPLVLAASLIFGLASFVYILAITYAASRAMLGRPTAVMDAYVAALERFVGEMLLSLKYVFIIALLWLLVVTIPLAVYLMVAWGMAYHVVLFEERGAWSATGRSRALVRGNWWRVVGMTLLVGIITGVLGGISGGLTAVISNLGLGGVILGGIITGLASSLLYPITYVGWLLLYLDLRARKDGLASGGELGFASWSGAPLPPA